jgi:hypothetical protein
MTANAGRPDLDRLVRAQHIPQAEPVFLTRGRDPAAPAAVRAWAVAYYALGGEAAVIEEALQQADRLEAWPEKQLPGADHLQEHERKQLEYQFSRRAYRAAQEPAPSQTAILLAERRGYDVAFSRARSVGLKIDEAWTHLMSHNGLEPEDHPDMALITRDELAAYMSMAADLVVVPGTGAGEAERG